MWGSCGGSSGSGSDSARRSVASWTVATLALEFHHALILLVGSVGNALLARSVLVGAGLAFCTSAMRFAAAVVARDHLPPSVDGNSARWLPAFTAHELE